MCIAVKVRNHNFLVIRSVILRMLTTRQTPAPAAQVAPIWTPTRVAMRGRTAVLSTRDSAVAWRNSPFSSILWRPHAPSEVCTMSHPNRVVKGPVRRASSRTGGCRRRCPILGGDGQQKDPRQMPWGLRCLPVVEVDVMPCAARCAGPRTRPGRPGSRRCRSARRRARGSWRCGRWSRRAG